MVDNVLLCKFLWIHPFWVRYFDIDFPFVRDMSGFSQCRIKKTQQDAQYTKIKMKSKSDVRKGSKRNLEQETTKLPNQNFVSTKE